MGPQDNLETFLELYEHLALLWGWPMEQWVACLIPLLSREAQLAAQQLLVANMMEYPDLKRAILQQVGRTPRAAASALPVPDPLRCRLTIFLRPETLRCLPDMTVG